MMSQTMLRLFETCVKTNALEKYKANTSNLQQAPSLAYTLRKNKPYSKARQWQNTKQIN